MSTLIVGMGMPGSGKSTLLRSLSEAKKWPIISVDAIRAEIGLGEADQAVNAEAWRLAHIRLAELQKSHPVVIFDATFVQPHVRVDFLSTARECGYTNIQGIVFDAPYAELERRMVERGRVVPESAMKRMHEQFHTAMPQQKERDEVSGKESFLDKLTFIETLQGKDVSFRELERAVSVTMHSELTRLR